MLRENGKKMASEKTATTKIAVMVFISIPQFSSVVISTSQLIYLLLEREPEGHYLRV
jgi:hypothetical protein